MSQDEPRIELATRAVRDLRRMDAPVRRRIRDALTELGAGAENADVKALAGQAPWLRLRVGDWRVIYRPLTEAETKDHGPGVLIARVVNRRDLLRAVRTL
jgi:mRNA interferase RelE/StbE